MAIGSGRPLEEAWRASQVEMITWLGELYGLDRLDAYQLLTQISQVPIANVVDTNYSAVTKIDKRLLPPAAAYGGDPWPIARRRTVAGNDLLLRDTEEDMDLGLSGKRFLVTGGTRGIGRAVVEGLLAEGAAVAYCARTADAVAETQAELTAGGATAIGIRGGRGRRRGTGGVGGGAADALGGIDGVVANVSALAIPESAENWHASFEVDLMGTVGLVEAALPHLLASGAGSIVTISSVSGREIDFASGPYGTIKAAIIHYTQGWRTTRRQGRAGQHGEPGQHLLPRRRLADDRAERPRTVRDRARAQPHRPDGHTAGGRQRRGIPQQPGGQLHHRHQPGGRRCADPGRSVLTVAVHTCAESWVVLHKLRLPNTS